VHFSDVRYRAEGRLVGPTVRLDDPIAGARE
jgi:hypothetical protein